MQHAPAAPLPPYGVQSSPSQSRLAYDGRCATSPPCRWRCRAATCRPPHRVSRSMRSFRAAEHAALRLRDVGASLDALYTYATGAWSTATQARRSALAEVERLFRLSRRGSQSPQRGVPSQARDHDDLQFSSSPTPPARGGAVTRAGPGLSAAQRNTHAEHDIEDIQRMRTSAYGLMAGLVVRARDSELRRCCRSQGTVRQVAGSGESCRGTALGRRRRRAARLIGDDVALRDAGSQREAAAALDAARTRWPPTVASEPDTSAPSLVSRLGAACEGGVRLRAAFHCARHVTHAACDASRTNVRLDLLACSRQSPPSTLSNLSAASGDCAAARVRIARARRSQAA